MHLLRCLPYQRVIAGVTRHYFGWELTLLAVAAAAVHRSPKIVQMRGLLGCFLYLIQCSSLYALRAVPQSLGEFWTAIHDDKSSTNRLVVF